MEQGLEYSVNRGRFGPYVMYIEKLEESDTKKKQKKPKVKGKYVSLPETDDPHTVSLERAIELVLEKAADAAKKIQTFEAQGIEVLNGRYGPYVTNGEKNAKVPKDIEPNTLTLAACEELLAAAPVRRAPRKKQRKINRCGRRKSETF